MNNRKSFVFYESWWSAIRHLPQRTQGIILSAIIEYGISGQVPADLPPVAIAILELIIPQIESNNQKYINGLKGAESGRLGGRPKKVSDTSAGKRTSKSKKTENKEGGISSDFSETPEKPLENPLIINEECIIENKNEKENVESSSSNADFEKVVEGDEQGKKKFSEKEGSSEEEGDVKENTGELHLLKLRAEIDDYKGREYWRASVKKKFKIAGDLDLDGYMEEFFMDAQCRDLKIISFSSYFTKWLGSRLENQRREAGQEREKNNSHYHLNTPGYGNVSSCGRYGSLESRLPLVPGYGLRDE